MTQRGINLPLNIGLAGSDDISDAVSTGVKKASENSFAIAAFGAVAGALAIWGVPKVADFVAGKFSDHRDGFGEGSQPYFPDDGGEPFDMDVED